MSMVRCDECDRLIDSDVDTDCFVSFSDQELIRQNYGDVALCKHCRAQSADKQIERRLDFIVRELDEFCAMAREAETADLIEAQEIAVGQILTRAQLILSFLAARKPPPSHIRRVS